MSHNPVHTKLALRSKTRSMVFNDRKSILKQVNSSGDSLSSPQLGRKINFRTPLVEQLLFDQEAAAKTVSETVQSDDDSKNSNSEDNEENLSMPAKAKTSLKRKRSNDFSVILSDDNARDNSATTSVDDGEKQISSISTSDADNTTASKESDNTSPKRKIRKKLDQLFDEIDDWESVAAANDTLQTTQSKQAKPFSVTTIDSIVQTETMSPQVQAISPMDTECLQTEKKTPEEDANSASIDIETQPEKEVEKVPQETKKNVPENITVISRSPLSARPTRAVAMMNSVIGIRATQLLVPLASPSSTTKRTSTLSSENGSNSPSMARFSRSHALVQASKKKQEDLIKSITEAASCPDLFETPEKSLLKKKSCLKSPLDSARKHSRKLSFADAVVTDELFYFKNEPSSCVKRDLQLRRIITATTDGDSPSPSLSSSSSEQCSASPTKKYGIDNFPESVCIVEEGSSLLKEKRKVLRHQTSIIEEIGTHDETKIDEDGSKAEQVNEDYYKDAETASPQEITDIIVLEHESLVVQSENFVLGINESFDIDDSQLIEHEMKNLAQDLTGQNVSNVGDNSAFGDDLFNVSSYSSKDTESVTATFSDDDDTENDEIENVQSDEEQEFFDENEVEPMSDISDYKDAVSILECDTDKNLIGNSEAHRSSSPAKNAPETDPKPSIQIFNDTPDVKMPDIEQLDNEPKIHFELPLSIARYVFDILKASLEPFNRS